MNAGNPGAAAAVLSAAAQVVRSVAIDGRSFDAALERVAVPAPLGAAVRAVSLGTLRWYLRLEPIAARMLQGKPLAPVLRGLLIAGLHQIEYSRNPVEATVSSAVDAARVLRQPRAAGMINALLRRFLRERATLLSAVMQDPAAASAHPSWLFAALRTTFPDLWPGIVEANNAHPPMTLRVDLSRASRERCLGQLSDAGIGARPVPWSRTAMVLDEPRHVAQLPGFDQGLISVQDAGAQLAAPLLEVRPGERVLDACAAPGGKSGALLEAAGAAIELTAVDIDASRLELIAQNLRRLRREARLVAADLTSELGWWDGQPFDCILLDAPCSSTGVIRRHPDIKLLRLAADIPAFAATQRQLLSRCLRLLRPGGRLLYSTCSLLPAENEEVVAQVLAQEGRSHELALPEPAAETVPWLTRALGKQLLPSDKAQTDGFYYACLTVT